VERVNRTAELVGASVLFANLAVGQSQTPEDAKRWNTVDRLCGRLEHVERRDEGDTRPDKTKSLKSVVLKLYQRDSVPCCESVYPAAEVKTGRGGAFSFSSVKPGPYWLVADINGREFKMPLRFQPDKSSDTLCSDQRFEVYDSGEIQIGRIITVD
jgi:hypothetical protein